jgi:hypothetical protein
MLRKTEAGGLSAHAFVDEAVAVFGLVDITVFDAKALSHHATTTSVPVALLLSVERELRHVLGL